jgi:hypothetical protein
MLTFKLCKSDPDDSSRFTVEGIRLLHLRSRYSVSVAARDFVGTSGEGATLSLHARDDSALVSVALEPDPMRRDVRTGTLDLSGPDTVRRFLALRGYAYMTPGSSIPRFVDVRLVVTLDGDTVLSSEIPVEFMPSQTGTDAVLTPEDAGIVDSAGIFYLPMYKRDGVQVYRRLMDYTDEYGASTQVSDEFYVKTAEGEFVVLTEVANG